MYGELGIGFHSWHVVFLDIYNVFGLRKIIVLGLLSWKQHVWNLGLISNGGLTYNKLKRIMCLTEWGLTIRGLKIIVTAKKKRIVLLKRRELVSQINSKRCFFQDIVMLSRKCKLILSFMVMNCYGRRLNVRKKLLYLCQCWLEIILGQGFMLSGCSLRNRRVIWKRNWYHQLGYSWSIDRYI